jgi:hypothetical protein
MVKQENELQDKEMQVIPKIGVQIWSQKMINARISLY